MPVRKIKKSYRQVTGVLSSKKNGRMIQSESTLERDLYLLLDFDPMVKSFEEQPIKVPHILKSGRSSLWTPDCLVELEPKPEFIWQYSLFSLYYLTRDSDDFTAFREFTSEKEGFTALFPKSSLVFPRNILIEVKYRSDLIENWQELKPKFKAARSFSKERNWDFRILTDIEIRRQLLDNIKFLRHYRRRSFSNEQISSVLKKIKEFGNCTINEILDSMTGSMTERGNLLPVIWQLVSSHEIAVDLDQPINMDSKLYLPSMEF